MTRRNLKQIQKAGTVLLVILLVLSLSSCATMFNGTQQLIPFNSQPQGAEVWIDGEFRGTTPVEVNLRRGVLQHEVLLKLGEFEQTVIVERAGMSQGGSAGLVIEILPGGTLAVLGIVGDLQECRSGGGGYIDLCGLGTAIAVFGVATAALPLGVDLATGAFYQLEPAEVFVEFE
ncbi:MAG: PEGA domain-containing protein [Trueperaceae bacterium]|nr:MAG: PEGA domain-containing protein [Trueperaceae bacterium]